MAIQSYLVNHIVWFLWVCYGDECVEVCVGSLIDVKDFEPRLDYATNKSFMLRHPEWYFHDAYFSGNRKWYEFTIQSSYPHSCAIHEDKIMLDGRCLSSGPHLRVVMRRWVERNLEGDVIWHSINMDYTVKIPHGTPANAFNTSVDTIAHGYFQFHFETEVDLLHFKLRFGDVVSDIQPTHPDYAQLDKYVCVDQLSAALYGEHA